jgi:hypothetical protein
MAFADSMLSPVPDDDPSGDNGKSVVGGPGHRLSADMADIAHVIHGDR